MSVRDRLAIDTTALGGGALLRSRVGVGALSILVLLVLVGLRALLGPVLAMALPVTPSILPVTYVALAGGFVGGLSMCWIIGIGVEVAPEERWRLRFLQGFHLVYGALVGAVFPWFYHNAFGSPVTYYHTYPFVVHSGQTWGILAFVVAAATYLAVGTIGSLGENLRQWGAILGMYLVYGTILGLWMGLFDLFVVW